MSVNSLCRQLVLTSHFVYMYNDWGGGLIMLAKQLLFPLSFDSCQCSFGGSTLVLERLLVFLPIPSLYCFSIFPLSIPYCKWWLKWKNWPIFNHSPLFTKHLAKWHFREQLLIGTVIFMMFVSFLWCGLIIIFKTFFIIYIDNVRLCNKFVFASVSLFRKRLWRKTYYMFKKHCPSDYTFKKKFLFCSFGQI